jgi:hypothetical protein
MPTMAEATALQGTTILVLDVATGTTGATTDTATTGTKAMVGTVNNISRAGSSRDVQPMKGTTGSTAILRRFWTSRTCPNSPRYL